MRINRLDLLRYGAFTDKKLTFRPDAKLHLIYGPNEAGKSSALSAIADLLFGFPTAASQSFLHDAPSLRVSADIATRNGDSLSFRRRRGRRNTLLADDAGETALNDDALSPFLGSLTRDVFERAFGLNSQRLREGGRAMLASGGEIGSLLFSAASGMMGLVQLRKSLEEEASAIYAPRRSQDRLFYQVLDRHEQARRTERDTELKSGDWKRLVSEEEDVGRQIGTLQQERRETREKLARLRTLKKLRPLIADIDRETAELQHFSDLPAFAAGFAQKLSHLMQRRREMGDAMAAARLDAGRFQAEIDRIEVDDILLAGSAEVLSRFSEIEDYRSKTKDLPRVQAEFDAFSEKLASMARRLGMFDTDTLLGSQPSDPDLTRMRDLLRKGRELARASDEADRRILEEQEMLSRLDDEAEAGRLIDPKPLGDRLAAISGDIADFARLDEIDVRIRRAEADLQTTQQRLSPAVTDLDRVLSSPLPDAGVIRDFQQSMGQADNRLRDAAERCRQLEAEIAELAARLEDTERGGAIVSRTDIEAARESRSAQWQLMEPALRGTEPLPQALAIDAFAHALVHADRLADLALADAARVTRHAEDQLRKDRAEQRLADATREADEARLEKAGLDDAFAALFAASGIEPGEPAAMLEWRRGVDRLAEERQTLDALLDTRDVLRLRRDDTVPVLRSIASEIGLERERSLPPAALARLVTRQIETLAERWSDRRSLEGQLRSGRERLEKLDAVAQDAHRQFETWKVDFADAAGAIGLDETSTPEMAETAIDLWRNLPELLLERENRARRVSGMQRDISAFETKVAAMVADIAPQFAGAAPDAAAESLQAAVMAANAGKRHRDALSGNLLQTRDGIARIEHELAEADIALGALLSGTGVRAEDAGLLVERLSERERCAARLSEARSRFDQQSEGEVEQTIRAGLEDFHPVSADLDIERLEAEDQMQVERYGELKTRLSDLERQRRAFEGGMSAERAVFEKLSAETEAQDLARKWVVLRVASSLLSASMESYRESRADPVMRQAGGHFSRLTGGRFARLVQDYGEGDELQLLAERVTGEKVPLGGLSEGTGDQLFLALRLAFMEDYATRNEPVPLIADDIFQTFDDERAACGLAALAQASGSFQPILFTHQSSLVEIARRELAGSVDVVEL